MLTEVTTNEPASAEQPSGLNEAVPKALGTELFGAIMDAAIAAADGIGLPGFSLAMVDRVGNSLASGHGVTNVEHPLAVTGTTIFQAGSVSKLFTALAAMKMVEAGQLDLDRPVVTWVPDLRLSDADATAELTPRHLLQHTGGWRGDYDADTGRGDDALSRMLAVIGEAPQLTALGSTFHYNNLGFVLLGHVMATAFGEPFETLVDNLVIRPLGLERTGFFLEDLAFQRLAAGHGFTADGAVLTDWARPRSRGPNGGVLTCADDLGKFARFHLGDGTTESGERLLQESSMQAMMAPTLPVRATGDAVGLGWMYGRWAHLDVLGHSGGTLGFRSRLTIVPEAGLGLVLLTNGTRGDKVIAAAQAALRAELVGEPPAKPAPVPPRDGLEAGFEGGLRLCFEDGLLVLRIDRESASASYGIGESGLDCFEIADGPGAGTKLEVLRDSAGSVQWLRIGGRLRGRVS